MSLSAGRHKSGDVFLLILGFAQAYTDVHQPSLNHQSVQSRLDCKPPLSSLIMKSTSVHLCVRMVR